MKKISRSEHERDADAASTTPPKKTKTLRSRLRYLRALRRRRFVVPVTIIVLFHLWLHLSNPYAAVNFVQQPFTTRVAQDGTIEYTQHFTPTVLTDPISDFIGYYRQGFLIVQNTLFGGDEIDKSTPDEIIDEIHTIRFDPNKPYLISGDQFSVLYTRNLGVFYNQLLDPNTAHDAGDWNDRQRIYLQSVLYAIEGISKSDKNKTTLVPLGPRTVTYTAVHPGDDGSDTVYGLLYAMNMMNSERISDDGTYKITTQNAIQRILREKKPELQHIVDVYRKSVQDPNTQMVYEGKKFASARDGVTRSSSLYDNIVLWKTLSLAHDLGISDIEQEYLDTLRQTIKKRYWQEEKGYYANDVRDDSFSSDWLLGFPTGFFDLADATDLKRTKRTVTFIENNHLADPLPIKYQVGNPKHMPFIIRHFVPNYGGEIIWSYWGAQYITLLTDLYDTTKEPKYQALAAKDIENYNAAIVRDGGFAETFNKHGEFLRVGLYKSIRVTGWVVQFEHAVYDHRRSLLEETATE